MAKQLIGERENAISFRLPNNLQIFLNPSNNIVFSGALALLTEIFLFQGCQKVFYHTVNRKVLQAYQAYYILLFVKKSALIFSQYYHIIISKL